MLERTMKSKVLMIKSLSHFFVALGIATFLASFPGLPRFYLPFAFTIIHGSGRPAFRRSSDSVYYCERKREIKTGEAWDRGYLVPRPSPAPVFDRLQYAKTVVSRSQTLAGRRVWLRGLQKRREKAW